MDFIDTVFLVFTALLIAMYVLCYRDENLRMVALVMLLVHLAFLPGVYLLTVVMSQVYGYGYTQHFAWLYYVYAAFGNWVGYNVMMLRPHYYDRLARQVHRIKSGPVMRYLMPLHYEPRRYAQEFTAVKVYKVMIVVNLLQLLQYPISWAFNAQSGQWHGIDLSWLHSAYVAFFGEDKYLIYKSYLPFYNVCQLVMLYIVVSLAFQSVKGLFVKNGIEA